MNLVGPNVFDFGPINFQFDFFWIVKTSPKGRALFGGHVCTVQDVELEWWKSKGAAFMFSTLQK